MTRRTLLAESKIPEPADDWNDVPPMLVALPSEARTPVYEDRYQPPKPRDPVNFGQPLWGFKHNPGADVVMGLALNYQQRDHKYFLGSLRRSGFKGDVVLGTQVLSKMRKETVAYLQAMGVIAYPIAPICNTTAKGQSIKQKICHWSDGHAPLPLAIIRHQLYLFFAQHYQQTSRFFVADYRDTFFQAEPFQGISSSQLHFYAEHYPFKVLTAPNSSCFPFSWTLSHSHPNLSSLLAIARSMPAGCGSAGGKMYSLL